MRVEAIGTEADWSQLEPVWDDLLYRTPEWTPFQSFRLQQLWWRHYHDKGRLYILVVREGSRLRGIAPFRIEPSPYVGVKRRLLKFIGEPSEMDRPTILRDGDDAETVRAVFEHLLERRSEWDCLLLYEQPTEGTVLSVAEELLRPPTLLVGKADGPTSPWVRTSGSWSEFLSSKSKNFRKALKRKHRQFSEEGTLTFETHTTWPDVEKAFQTYVDVEERSWKAKDRLSLSKVKGALAYHTALVQELGPLGKVQACVLRLDDRPIAATLGLEDRGKFLSLHIAHDEAYGRFSPGVLLTAHELEECYARPDCNEYDFLGGYLNNKMSWTSDLRETSHFYAYRNDALFRVHYAWYYRIEPGLKDLLRRLGVFEHVLRLKNFLLRVPQGRQSV